VDVEGSKAPRAAQHARNWNGVPSDYRPVVAPAILTGSSMLAVGVAPVTAGVALRVGYETCIGVT
jgi:hypothetical protein